MKFFKTKTFWFILVVIVLLLVFIFIPKGQPSTSYTTDVVKKDTVVNLVSESGNIYVQGQFDVYSSINGVISEIYVKNGETVKEGQKLFRVKSTSTDQEKASAYASYLKTVSDRISAEANKTSLESQLITAKKAVVDAQINVDIMNSNIDDDIVNPVTHESYTTNDKNSINYALTAAQKNRDYLTSKYYQADNEIAAAKKSEDSAKIAYDLTNDTTITADVAGTIYNLAFVVGDTVSPQTSAGSVSASGSTSSSAIMTIANLSNIYAKIAINEVDISMIKLGQSAQITLDAIKDKTYTGKVFNIDTIGTDKDSVITYNVYISIDNSDESIKPNMSVNVSIETARYEDVLTVPNSAIKLYKDAKAVQVFETSASAQSKSKQKTLKYVPVQIGLKGTDKTEILSGINEGDEVITGTTNTTKSSGLFGLGGN